MKLSKFGVAAVVLILAMVACNIPSAEQVPLPSDAQTAAALTVQAILTVSVTASSTSTAVAATITPTFSTPMLTVKEQTNCRKGPGEDYEIVFTYLPNKKLTILGRYDPGNFWLVKSDEVSSGQCWLWGQYVEVTGSYWTVPSVTPPPTATGAPPLAPAFEKWNYNCTYNGVNSDLNVTLLWTDRATNETGYRIVRNGELLVELAANSTSYVDVIAVDIGENATYRVDAYNSSGASSTSTITLSCSGS
jgi:hypothetical protein